MINKIDFNAKNLTSNAGLFLLLENVKNNAIFEMIENNLIFESDSVNKIKMNHIKTMLCGYFIGIDKRGNAENYIKEAKYDMAVGHLLLKSFWANEAVFQMMMLSYNLFLLSKFDYLDISEYR